MRSRNIAMLAGILPILAANLAFWINVGAGLDGCFPYWEGCYSVSRGVRSGEGLGVFKALAIPGAVMMGWCWIRTTHGLPESGFTFGIRGRWAARLGVAGAIFFLVYIAWLGVEGDVYRWMRRYGVVFYFGFTGLAHLLLASNLWNMRGNLAKKAMRRAVRTYFLLTVFTWILGVASAFKRKLVDDPSFLDRVENALEWNFAFALSTAFLALAFVFRSAGSKAKTG